MSGRLHHYDLTVTWTGNLGEGTSGYRAYSRDHVISAAGKPDITASSDPSFRGDTHRYNPEELLVAALSSCHMLWMLHLCAEEGIVVLSYQDAPSGVMQENADGSGQFREVVLRPLIQTATPIDDDHLTVLHHRAHIKCFIARSVNFLVKVVPEV
ncbi:MAG: OsmC family protein [Saprospiraceae bacterium]